MPGFGRRPNILMPPSSPDTDPLRIERFESRHKSRRGIDWRALARFGLGLVGVAWSLLLLAWLTLHWGILPHVNEWRPQIEAQASRTLGVPVRIGRIQVQSSGWVPALRLDDVVLYDAAQHEALRLPRVAAAVSARSLLAFSLRFEQLLIENARLEVRRDAQGRIFVAGLRMQGGAGEGGEAAADWFFEQHEFVIRHGSVRWIDERGNAPPLDLADVDLVVRNGLRSHAMRIDATPPPEWGERFTLQGRFTQPLLARHGDWRRWHGTLHAQLPRADVSQLRRHVALPFELSQGEGALRAWLDIDAGEPRAATVDVALNAVNLKLQRDLEPLSLAELQGRFSMRRDDKGVTLAAQDFTFVTGEGQRWPRSRLQLGWQQRQDKPDQPITGGEASADLLDLGLMADVAERLPLGAALRKLLAETAPRGEVRNLSARWEGPLDAPQRYAVKARLAGLSIAAGPVPQAPAVGRPGWQKAQIDLHATEAGGEARLNLDGGALEFPGVFEQPVVALDRFDAELAWRITPAKAADQPPAVELKVANARFANQDAEGELNAAWRTGPGTGTGRGARYPGLLDMSGRLTRGQATSVARYLPLGIPAETRDYVARSVLGGQVEAATFKVKGDLWQFPFSNAKEGEFRIAGTVSDVTLAYVPGAPGEAPPWPAFDHVGGELVFDRNSMEIRQARARVYGYELSGVQGGIRNLADKSTLVIEGQGRGPLADALRYVAGSPIAGWTSHALGQASGNGPSELKLALSIPLHDAGQSTVKGSVTLLGNDLRIRPDTPQLGNAKARVEFTHKGFAIRGGSARVLGGDASIEGGTQPDGSLRFMAQGVATADGLRRATELPVVARMAGSFSGQAPYRFNLGIVKGQTEIGLTSPLTGLALDLPAPLRKSAEAALPLRLVTQLATDTLNGPAPRDTLRLELGSVLQAQYQRDLSHDTPQVLSGAMGVLETMPAPASPVAANVNLGVFDADAWQQVATRWFGSGGAAAGPASAADTGAADDGYLPRQLAVRAQELHIGGRRLSKVVANLSTVAGAENRWHADIVAEQLAGVIEYRLPRGSGAGRVFARLSRLSLPPAEVASVESLLEQAPTSVPALDIVVDDFDLRGRRLGKLEIEAQNRSIEGRGSPREWRLTKFNLGMPEAQLQATGLWSPAVEGRRRMVMNFTLDVNDGGALLTRLGTEGALRGGKGRLQGQVSWSGSPFSLDYPSLNGQLNLALDNGRFLKAGAGAARLLGVLSLQSLPRRLALDFRDVFQEGFAFDHAAGDVQIHDGVASTNNLRMRGVQAAVLMEGEADIGRETQDLRVVVVPEINAGTASLAYAAINPAVGLGTFLAQLFLRKPLMEASTREFHVSGSWDDPKVDRVQHKGPVTVPDIEAAAQPTAGASSPVGDKP
jgi:uncharacterized protein (TIGR02099 family)